MVAPATIRYLLTLTIRTTRITSLKRIRGVRIAVPMWFCTEDLVQIIL